VIELDTESAIQGGGNTKQGEEQVISVISISKIDQQMINTNIEGNAIDYQDRY
jgi:hypothetical protein